MAKAVSVQAANVTPRRSNKPGSNGDEAPMGSALETYKAWLPAVKVRLVVPREQHGDRTGHGGDRDPEAHHLGEGPAPPSEALGPREPEGPALELTGEQWRTDEGADHRGHHLENEPVRQKSVHPIEGVDQAVAGKRACRVAGDRCAVGMVEAKAGDPETHRNGAEQHGHAGQCGAVLAPGDPGHPAPLHRRQLGVLVRTGENGECGQHGHAHTCDCSV